MPILTVFGKYSQHAADIGYVTTCVMANTAGPAVMTGAVRGQP